MENQQVEITITPCIAWLDVAAAWLAGAVDTAEDLRALRLQFESGASLFGVWIGGACCGAFLLRIDSSMAGPVGVVVAAGGNYPGISLLGAIMPQIEKLFIGCKSLRVHSSRPGIAKPLLGLGFKPSEIVYQKELSA